MTHPSILLLLAITLLVAVVTDVRSQRIPNWLTIPAALGFVVLHGMFSGFDGLTFSLLGLLVGFGLMLPAYAIGVMGAGDVKLMAAIGAALGTKLTLYAYLFTGLAGGLYALVTLAFRRDVLRKVLGGVFDGMMVSMGTRTMAYQAPAADATLPRLCYGVAIAVGTTVAVWRMAPQAMETLQLILG